MTLRAVNTPNGPGILLGRAAESDPQAPRLVVQHQVSRMTGREAGTCLTPNGQYHALYEYDYADVSPIEGG